MASRIPLGQKIVANAFYPLTAALCSLGCWQTKRHFEKKELLDQIAAQKISGKILLLDDRKLRDQAVQKRINYYKVAVRGNFDHTREILIRPRARIIPEEEQQEQEGSDFAQFGKREKVFKNLFRDPNETRYGAFVITPFVLKPTGKRKDASDEEEDLETTTILVNRGWISDQHFDQKDRDPESFPQGEVAVFGVFRREGDRNLGSVHITDETEQLKRDYHHTAFKHHGNLCEHLSKSELAPKDEVILPVCIDEDERSASKDHRFEGTPVGNQTQLDLPNNHLGYLIQWFGLAAAALYVRKTRFGKGTEYYRLLQLERASRRK